MPLYSFLLALALILGSPFWLVRMLTSGRYRAGLRERLGHLRPGLRVAAPNQPTLWLHAVSVGELLAATGLLRELERALPTHRIVLSTTTEAGQRLARQRFPNFPVFYLPLDFATLVRRHLRALRPHLLILMESELWPNLLREAARATCPVVVANARISDRSFPRYLRLRRLWQPILRPVALFLAQSAETAARLQALGIGDDRIRTPGNLKFDTPEPRPSPTVQAIATALPAASPLLIAGSTLPGEEDLLLAAWPALLRDHPSAILLLAPRHSDRFPAMAALIARHRLPLARASALPPALAPGSVLLLDTIGDLSAAYSLATAAFIGGSLVPSGGHNPLEPARFAVPTAIGPSIYNFRDVVQTLVDAQAILHLQTSADLAPALSGLLRRDDSFVRDLGHRAQAVFQAETGAALRSVHLLLPLLPAEARS